MRATLAFFWLVAATGCPKGEETTVGGPIGIIGGNTSATNRNLGRGSRAIGYAHVRRTRAPVPERFSAPLLSSLAEFDDASRRPPDGYVRGAICAGDRSMQQQVIEALRAAESSGELEGRVAQYYSNLFRYCETDDACEWLRSVVKGRESRRVKDALWPALAGCSGDRYVELFTKEDAPSKVVIEWYFEQSWRAVEKPLPLTPRLIAAATDVAVNGELFEVRQVGLVLAAIDHPRALQTLRAISRRVADPERRPYLFIGLREHSSPVARRLFARACADPVLAQEPLCSSSTGGSSAEAHDEIESLIRAWNTDLPGWLAQRPKMRPRVLWSLTYCVMVQDEASGRCLGRLALIDRARALKLAAELPIDPPPEGYLAEVAFALLRFPDRGALAARLAELGLVDPGRDFSRAITVAEHLASGGRSLDFDTETGTFPNEHDVLARSLAGLIALDDVIFEEIAPPEDGGNYLLRAYSQGMRLETIARNYDDWYDLDAVLGLLNVVLRDRKSPYRYVTLPTGDQTAVVLVAPEDGLRRAMAEGLIILAGTAESMNAGKSFEQQVFEQLRNSREPSPEAPPPPLEE